MIEICISGNHVDYSKVINEDCDTFHELSISTTELHIKTENVNIPVQSAPSLKVALGNDKIKDIQCLNIPENYV